MIKVAQTAARTAGKILLDNFRKIPANEIRRKLKNDFISFVDEQSEKSILKTIADAFPEHAFLAEEQGGSAHDHDYLWIIDPLDGTTNYLQGVPVFAISIGLLHKGQPKLGVIYDPLHDEMFWAERGKGAFLNGRPITVSKKSRLDESFIATGFPFKAKHLLEPYLATFQDIFKECIGKRRMGAAAIDLAYVAAGRFDGFWELGLSPWDQAAGWVIVEEAGGKVTDFWGNQDFLYSHYTLASNGLIHKQLIKKISKHFEEKIKVYQ
ncbi:MAG TPA: inositol monophosphatase [Caldithrix abyssi]|uniref:Inositol-1-monophosphatase n=1 Tax=Caldithrix abyssi TaxID=187145 RepID=A0A7V5H2P9_CALAY|nr:inositol monophosphatase [Caldisericaceae bacterium]HHE54577.1 inositol monophosphatase [Caldithrix abyssi]